MAQDIYALLQKDHREVEELFGKLEKAGEDERVGLLEEIAIELMLHSKAEEETFYAQLEDAGESLEDSYDEHEEVESLADECFAAIENPEELLAKVAELKQVVLHHVQEEESRIFERARELLAGREAELGQEFERRKIELRPDVEKEALGEVTA